MLFVCVGVVWGCVCNFSHQPTLSRCRYHSKALLVSFDTDNDSASSVTEALTREIQSSFKKLDLEIRDIVKGKGVNEDEAVRGQVQRQLAQVSHE